MRVRQRGGRVVMSEGRERIDGLKLIAQYLKLSERQVRALYQVTVPVDERLPVFRLSASRKPNCRLSAFTEDLDAWMDRMSQQDFYLRPTEDPPR